MYRYGGVTKVNGMCGNCEDDLVLYVLADGGPLANGTDECETCEQTDFQVVS